MISRIHYTLYAPHTYTHSLTHSEEIIIIYLDFYTPGRFVYSLRLCIVFYCSRCASFNRCALFFLRFRAAALLLLLLSQSVNRSHVGIRCEFAKESVDEAKRCDERRQHLATQFLIEINDVTKFGWHHRSFERFHDLLYVMCCMLVEILSFYLHFAPSF